MCRAGAHSKTLLLGMSPAGCRGRGSLPHSQSRRPPARRQLRARPGTPGHNMGTTAPHEPPYNTTLQHFITHNHIKMPRYTTTRDDHERMRRTLLPPPLQARRSLRHCWKCWAQEHRGGRPPSTTSSFSSTFSSSSFSSSSSLLRPVQPLLLHIWYQIQSRLRAARHLNTTENCTVV